MSDHLISEKTADVLIDCAPYGILLLNESLEIQKVNKAFCAVVGAEQPSELVGKPVGCVLEEDIFHRAIVSGQLLCEECAYLPMHDRYVEWNIHYDESIRSVVCFMRDTTTDVAYRLKRERISKRTMEVTDRMIEKQMRVVQEIASLLGETTAETKIALTKLKESLKDE